MTSSEVGQSLTVVNTLIVLGSALVLGLLISLVYLFTHRREGWQASFPVTLIMLPAIISIIILLVGNNVARAFSLAGAFSLIRFRSAPGDPKDIAYVFFTLAVGLSCGMGYIGYAAVFALVLCAVMMLLTELHFAQPKETQMLLKVTVPEDLNYQGIFDEVLKEYTDSWRLDRIKTSAFGTLFELVYQIRIRDGADTKAFLDAVRCRNGNLNISLVMGENNASNIV